MSELRIHLRPLEDGATVRKGYAVCLEIHGVIGLYEFVEPEATRVGDIILTYDVPSEPFLQHEILGFA